MRAPVLPAARASGRIPLPPNPAMPVSARVRVRAVPAAAAFPLPVFALPAVLSELRLQEFALRRRHGSVRGRKRPGGSAWKPLSARVFFDVT